MFGKPPNKIVSVAWLFVTPVLMAVRNSFFSTSEFSFQIFSFSDFSLLWGLELGSTLLQIYQLCISFMGHFYWLEHFTDIIFTYATCFDLHAHPV